MTVRPVYCFLDRFNDPAERKLIVQFGDTGEGVGDRERYGSGMRRERAVEIFIDHGQGARHEVAEIVGKIGVVSFRHGGPGDVAVDAEGK